MTEIQTSAQPTIKPPRLIDADHLIARLTALSRQQEERGRISHALGVRSAIELVKRELSSQRRQKQASDKR